MGKIETKSDIAKKKARAKAPKQVNLGSGRDDLIILTENSFVKRAVDERRAAMSMQLYDRTAAEDMIRDNLNKMGRLELDANKVAVRDARIDKKTEKKLLEFAARMTDGDSEKVVELADNYVKVTGKSEGDADQEELIELAEIPRAAKRQRVETGE